MVMDAERLSKLESLFKWEGPPGSTNAVIRELIPIALDGLRWREAAVAGGEVEAASRAAMVDNVCGCTLETGERVFCDDYRIPAEFRNDCSCKSMAAAAIQAAAVWREANAPKMPMLREEIPHAPR
jgi:hypothetical protein